MTDPADLLVSRCVACQHRFAPRNGPCPKCGSREVAPLRVPAFGRVLAATELMIPTPAWPAPHRLAIVELAEEVRLLVVVDGGSPNPGDLIPVQRDGELYRSPAGPTN